jgi:hypothetical protein
VPRKRQLHPEFWKDSKISRLPVEARLAFLWSLNIADDEGRFRCDAPTLSSAVFRYEQMPHDEAQEIIDDLVRSGRWLGYDCHGEAYFVIPHWHAWQSINRPSPSKLPEPPDEVRSSYEERFGPFARSRSEAKEIISGPGSSGLSRGKKLSRRSPANDEREAVAWELFNYWQDAVREIGEREGRRTSKGRKRVFSDKRRRLVVSRLKEGYTLTQLKDAVDGCLVSPWHRGQNPTGTLYEDIELICRDASKVDQFIAIGERSGGDPDAAEDNYLDDVVEQTLARRKRVRRVGRRSGGSSDGR